MLVLTRSLLETVVIKTPTIIVPSACTIEGWMIEVTPVEIRTNGRVRLSFRCADEVRLYRSELKDRQPMVIGDYGDYVRQNREAKALRGK